MRLHFIMSLCVNQGKSLCRDIKKLLISERRINTLCLEGRIAGAEKFGNVWAIPEDSEKPKDDRIKSGKYRKWGERHNLST